MSITITRHFADACCCNGGVSCSFETRAKTFQGCFGGRPSPGGNGSNYHYVEDERSAKSEGRLPSPNTNYLGYPCYPAAIGGTVSSTRTMKKVASQGTSNFINYLTTTNFSQSVTGFWNSSPIVVRSAIGTWGREVCPPFTTTVTSYTTAEFNASWDLAPPVVVDHFPDGTPNYERKITDPENPEGCNTWKRIRYTCPECAGCAYNSCITEGRDCGTSRRIEVQDEYSIEDLADAEWNSGNEWIEDDNEGYHIPVDFAGKTVSAYEVGPETDWDTGGAGAIPTCFDGSKALIGRIFVTGTESGEDYIIGFNLVYQDLNDPEAEAITTAIGIIVSGGAAEIEQDIEVPLRSGFRVSISACGAVPATPENLANFNNGLANDGGFQYSA